MRPVRIERIDVVRNVAAHDHTYYEICLIEAGEVTHQTSRGQSRLSAGMVTIIPPGEVHALYRPRKLTVTNIYYLSEWLLRDLRLLLASNGIIPLFVARSLFPDGVGDAIGQFPLDMNLAGKARQEINDLSTELQREKPSDLYLRSTFLKLLVHLTRAQLSQGDGAGAARFSMQTQRIMQRIEDTVMSADPIDIPRLIGARYRQQAIRFRRATGLSPMQYYQKRRIQQAATLMLQSDTSVTEAAMELGYFDAAHFIRHFQRWMGLSPSAYRSQYRGDESNETPPV
jgi:AraC-like DNA-binding protein